MRDGFKLSSDQNSDYLFFYIIYIYRIILPSNMGMCVFSQAIIRIPKKNRISWFMNVMSGFLYFFPVALS